MATTEKYYDGDGSNQTFAIPASIPFLDTTDIKVQVGSLKVADGTNSAGQTLTHGIATAEFPNDTDLKVRISTVLKTLNTDYTLSADKTVITFTDAVPSATGNIRVCTNGSTQNQGTDYTINASNEVAFTTAPANTKSVRIYRETDLENLKGGEFAPGTAITAAQLNDNAKQALYAAQEFPANFGDARNYGWNIPPATKNDIQVISDTDWKIVDGAVTGDMLQDDSVSTDKIQDLAVTTDKIANNAVTAAKIPDGSISHIKLGSDTNIYRAYASVRDYGAKGDNSTDDTAAIKNAIAAQDGQTLDNNVLYFPAGIYIVTEPIIIPSNTYLQGAGMHRTIIKMSSTVGRATALCVVGNPDSQVVNVTINDLRFDGNSARWHGYNVSTGTPNVNSNNTEYVNYTGVYGASVTSGATYTQSGKIVTVTKTNHGLEHGAYVTIISADNDTSSIVNADHATNPMWEVIQETTNTFKLLVSSSQTISSNAITYKECIEGADGKGLFIHNSWNVHLNRVAVYDAPDHNFDISATATHGNPVNTANGDSYDEDEEGYYMQAALWHERYCENIYLNHCHSKGAGDDNFTTHFSRNIFFNDCYSEYPRGGKSTSSNTNCYEIDDGSSNVTISNCQARGGNDALEIKAHGYAPPPFNIFVNGFTAINSTKGISLHHSNWYINTEKPDVAWKVFGGDYDEDYVETKDSAPSELRYSADPLLSDNGYSLHARNVQLDNIRIIALCDRTLRKLDGSGNEVSETVEPEHAIQITGYRGVSVSNLYISEGLADRQYGSDSGGTANHINIEDDDLPFAYEDASTAASDSDALIMLRRSCRDITFTNTVINGYWDKFARAAWIRRRTQTLGESDGDGGTYSEHDQEQVNGGIIFNGFTCIDGPLIAFEGNGSDETYWGTLTGYNINQTQQIPSAGDGDEDPNIGDHWRDSDKKAIDVTSELWQLGSGTIHGYGDDESIGQKDWPVHIMNEANAEEEHTIAATEKTCFYERIGNLVFCTATFKDISHDDNDGASADAHLCVTLPFEPISGSPDGSKIFTGTFVGAYIDTEEGSSETSNIVCVAVKENMYKKDNIQYKGYVKFKKTRQDPSTGDGESAEYIKCSDVQNPAGDAESEFWFQIWYICHPNAIPNK